MKTTIGIIVGSLLILTLAMMPANASDVTYKIRSTVYDNTDPSVGSGDFYWDANAFSSFWFQIKPGLSSEVLYIHNSVNSSEPIKLGDKIEEGDLYYVSKPQTKKAKIGGSDSGVTYIVDGVDLKKYYLMGFFGSQYVAMPKDPSDLSAGCKPDKIARILMEFDSDKKKQMFSGDEWKLADGWSLVVQQVDAGGNKVCLQLKRNGKEMNSAVLSGDMNLEAPERTYLYKDCDDNPVFYCYVDSIFRGMDADFVVFKYAYLRSDLISFESGDNYDIFDVEGFVVPAVMNGTNYAGSGSGTVLNTGDDALVMASNEDVTLDPDEIIDLYGGMYLKTEATSGSCLKMTLWKTCTITVPDEVVEEKVVEEEEEVVVIDMAEEDDSGSMHKVIDEVEDSSGPLSQDATVVKSSVTAPGFRLILCILGFLGAMTARRY
jgi:S-layer protein (TIGR01567 family)